MPNPTSVLATGFRIQPYSRATSGGLRAAAHHTGVLWAGLRFELAVGRWKKLDPQLKTLAVMSSAATVGCSWCTDFGYWENHRPGMDPRKLREARVWRESEAYTPLERDVMAYAEAMSLTPPEVGDELMERLRTTPCEAPLVELTTTVVVENMRSRTNSALGPASQGFKDRCAVERPAGRRPMRSGH
ncbi:carboxymuconolactone decarboxylase family protein [Streptomyces sp. NPDC057908]|uniref:carboxymuconolactone decarboxylase family protein n=1 Tax=Streptomyces sp. NPDC057908 TaxID=3346276 RepID=UPI0036E359E8